MSEWGRWARPGWAWADGCFVRTITLGPLRSGLAYMLSYYSGHQSLWTYLQQHLKAATMHRPGNNESAPVATVLHCELPLPVVGPSFQRLGEGRGRRGLGDHRQNRENRPLIVCLSYYYSFLSCFYLALFFLVVKVQQLILVFFHSKLSLRVFSHTSPCIVHCAYKTILRHFWLW